MRSVQKASKKDLSVIQHIATVAYHDTYVPILGQEQVDFMLDKTYSLNALQEQLDQGHMFIIALEQEQKVGFASFTLMEANKRACKLHKLYLLPEKKGSGLGKFLVNEVILTAKKLGSKSLLLNVNRFNKAIGFYEKMGFSVKEKVDIPIGERYYMNDFIMERDIA